MKRMWAALAGLAAMGAGTPAPGGGLKVELDGLRSSKGVVHLCLTASERQFLHCQKDRNAVARTVPATSARLLDLGTVKPGTYALLIIHDENGNGRLDMMMGIPREGFGFSNNPAMRPRAPRWDEIRFTMPAAPLHQQVRIRYVL
jgi:uncharacterized protein (DUF2141 family)